MSADSSRLPHQLPPGWLERRDTKHRVLAELSGRAVRRRRRRIAAGAIACAVAMLAAIGAWQLRPPGKAVPDTIALTAPLREVLPDGSVIERKSDAAYEVRFDENTRRVVLTRGTAHFDVAKNPERPFVVTAGRVSVRAVGTAFSVEFDQSAVAVLVTEGQVAVAPVDADDWPTEETKVEAGTGVVIGVAPPADGRAPVVQPVSATTMEQKLAWRVRLVEFSGTPLTDAIAVLNAHNRVQFSIADPTLSQVKLSGVIRADQIAGVVRLLEEEGVRVERRGDSEIVLFGDR